MTSDPGTGANRTARIAGTLYLLMMPFAMFTLYVRMEKMPGADAAATAANIAAAPDWFGAAIVTWLASQVISIFLVVQLHKLLKPVNPSQALLMLALALVGVPITCANETHQFAVLLLLQDPTQVAMHLRLHEYGLKVAQIFWGLWLLPLGWLVFRSGFLPRWLGILLLIAGAGYLVDLFIGVVFPNAGVTATTVTFVGELLLPLWLLIRGAAAGQVPKETAAR